MDALVAFGAALLTFRLAGLLAARYRSSQRPELFAWSAGLAAYAVAAAAIAWGEAAGWDERASRVYYAAGALLTAPLLGAGSLLPAGRRRAGPGALVFGGVAPGVPVAVPGPRSASRALCRCTAPSPRTGFWLRRTTSPSSPRGSSRSLPTPSGLSRSS